ncbi:unnamed protein product [Schistocephalus solidus]|uniref:CA domain-containing protein n=1 Tax=Schistocephalus solidus TaxID=70667 RepID=A0A183SHC8_SCHSO|nr:unnamed protein product [Schistocephalus solidus]
MGLTCLIPLDRETVDRITLIATVTDATKGKIYTATATISVEVLDENDNSPVFVNPPANMGPSFPQDTIDSYAFNVRENSPPYTRLSGRLEARDPDAGQNGQVHFSLRSTWALKGGTQVHRSGFALDDLAGAPGRQLLDQRIFQITPEGGIETLVELDRESVSSYLLNVAVRDNGSQPLASTAMLLVLVLDENDNPPVWTFPTESARQINITTANQPGTLVARLQAYDIDADAAGTVEFQILDPHGQPMPPISLARGLYNAQPATPHTAEQSSTNQALSEIGSSLMGYRTGPFYLNGSTGEILVADTLVPMSLKIRIRASDCGPNPLYTDTWMIVNVQMDPDESAGFLGVGRAGALNVTIILVMIAVTAIISILLIIAIVCVRRKPARYNGVVQEGPDYASPCQTVCAGSPYIDPSKEALTSNTWSATIGSKDCSGTFYPQSGGPRSVPGQGSLVIDENGQVFSSVPLSYGSPVVCGSVMGTSDNTSLVCFPQPNSVSMISGTPYASDFNGDLSIGMPMHTFGGRFSPHHPLSRLIFLGRPSPAVVVRAPVRAAAAVVYRPFSTSCRAINCAIHERQLADDCRTSQLASHPPYRLDLGFLPPPPRGITSARATVDAVTLTRNQRSTLGSLQGSTPAVRMGSGLQYEPPPLPDADSGDSGRGPSEDGNQLLLMDNQRTPKLSLHPCITHRPDWSLANPSHCLANQCWEHKYPPIEPTTVTHPAHAWAYSATCTSTKTCDRPPPVIPITAYLFTSTYTTHAKVQHMPQARTRYLSHLRLYPSQSWEQSLEAGTTPGNPMWLPTTPLNNRHDLCHPPATREVPGDATHLYTTFVDLTKAFDTVNRDRLWKVMRKFGCPERFTHMVRQLHGGMTARVTDNGTVSEAFTVTNGVKQGCVLAPTFFSLMFSTMLMDAYRDEQPGIRIAYRTDGHLLNSRRIQSMTCSSWTIAPLTP